MPKKLFAQKLGKKYQQNDMIICEMSRAKAV